jgi:hypothetical protein
VLEALFALQEWPYVHPFEYFNLSGQKHGQQVISVCLVSLGGLHIFCLILKMAHGQFCVS